MTGRRFTIGVALVAVGAATFAIAFRTSLSVLYGTVYHADNVVDAVAGFVFQAAELEMGETPRLVGRDPRLEMLARLLIEMRAELLIELLLDRATAQQSPCPDEKIGEHVVSVRRQHAGDRDRQFAPRGLLRLELPSTARCELVELGSAVVVRHA
jgi:hypothetical protein